jgi:hypothetical protein
MKSLMLISNRCALRKIANGAENLILQSPTELHLIYTNSVLTSQETLCLRHKDQPVNAVWGNSRYLV